MFVLKVVLVWSLLCAAAVYFNYCCSMVSGRVE